jgi:hypothetical protein
MRAKPRKEGVRVEHEEHGEHMQHNPIQFWFTLDSSNHYPDRISRGKNTRLNPPEKTGIRSVESHVWKTGGRITSVKDKLYKERFDTIDLVI